MNKLFTKIAGLTLGLVMAIGVGIGFGVGSSKEAVPVHAAASQYELITSTSDLTSGSHYLIGTAKTGTAKFANNTEMANYRPLTSDIAITNGKVNFDSSMLDLVLGGSTGAWTFTTTNYGGTNGYLRASSASSKSNYLYVNATADSDNYDKFQISFSNDAAVIKANGTNERWLAFGNGDRISSYRNQNQNAIYLFKEVAAQTPASLALSGTYPTTFYQGETFSHDGMVVTVTYTGTGDKANVTNSAVWSSPDMSTTGSKTVTVSYTENSTEVSTTYSITVNAARALSSIALSGTYKTEYYVGDTLDTSGVVVTAYFDDETSEEVTGETTFTGFDSSSVVDSQTITASYTYSGVTKTATYDISIAAATSDTLTRATTGVTSGSSTYSDWTATVSTGATYKGNSAGGNNSIQLRGEKDSGLVMTTSVTGKQISKVTIVFQASTSNGRTVNVYGKNTAYSAPSDLYVSANQGTLLGSIVNGTSTELEISIVNRCSYIGIRSSSGAIYISSVTFAFAEPEPAVSELTLSPSTEQTIKVGNSQTFTIDVTGTNLTGSEVATITYTPVELTSSAITLSVDSALADGGTFTLTANTKDAAGTLKVTCLGVDSNEVDIYTEEAKTLSNLAVTTTGKTGYVAGKTFSKTGFVVTATYTDETSISVQDAATWNVLRGDSLLAIDTALADGDKVRITYEEGGVSKTADITLTIIESIANINGSYEGIKTVSKAASDLGLDNAADVSDVTLSDSVKLNGGKYYNSDTTIRVYKDGTFIISSDKAISQIVFTMAGGYIGTVSSNTGTYSLDGLTGTWTGSATSITFSHTPSENVQWRIQNISVTYLGTASGNISNEFYDAQRVVLSFAKDLYDTLDDVCVGANYESSEFITAWELVADEFSDYFIDNSQELDEVNLSIAKQLLSGAVANYSGDTLQKAMARYDFIVAHSDLPAFMKDGDTPLRSLNADTNNIFGFDSAQSASITIITIVSLVSLTAIAGFVILRKRKEQ